MTILPNMLHYDVNVGLYLNLRFLCKILLFSKASHETQLQGKWPETTEHNLLLLLSL